MQNEIVPELGNHPRTRETKRLLFLSNLLQEPFVALNLMLDVMLSAHFGASALQISILTTLRPVLAVCAFYWGSMLFYRPELLRFSLVAATSLATIFFLFAPWADSIWYFIVAESCFVLFWRAANPAQMEILKTNLDKGAREKIFSQALSVSHASGMIIGPLLGIFLKINPDIWKELFCIGALFYGASAWVKSYFYVPATRPPAKTITGLKQAIITPWKDSWKLLKTNKRFAQFQLGFFIAGSGLMFAKPSIPGFLTGMNLSILEIFSLFTLLEGLGFILAASFWAKYLQKTGIHKTACLIVTCFSLQPLLLIMPVSTMSCVFLAYFFYGAAQAGSRLVWHLSGPLLCGNESSSQYTSVNILAIGVRGMFVPLMGAGFAQIFGPAACLAVSFLFMVGGALYLFKVQMAPIEANS
ncbi:MAG: MFS transporter [Chlamydiales bacterium]|nr:MFS transporter [Chlamydiales bacterium]